MLMAALCGLLLASAAAASTLTPRVFPLIVRNPYLSTWLPNARDEPWRQWPMFWHGQDIGFSVLASYRVPSATRVFPLLGRPHDSVNSSDEWASEDYTVDYPVYLGAQYDASTTNLTYHLLSPASAEPLEVILSFLSPITPTSTLRQSLPASYLTVYVKGSFDVDVYVDVNGHWVSGIKESRLKWDFGNYNIGQGKSLKTWSVRREDERLFEETDDRSEWGTLHFTGPDDVRHECGSAHQLRQRFSRTGTLENAIDDRYRSIMDEEPVFAFAKSFKLGSATSRGATEDSVRFTIAHTQDRVVRYASERGLTHMRPLWMSYFKSESDVLAYHYFDYFNAVGLADDYSAKVAIDGIAYAGSDHADVLALSARQVMGATSFAGTPEHPMLFLKEISSNGNCQTVDVIFPAFPFFLYTNPRWLAYLLEPLLEHQLSGQYPNKYSMHDLGTHFPNMTGHADGADEYMPLEECGDMLIMALALVQSLQHISSTTAGSPWSSLGAEDATAGIGSKSQFPLLATLEQQSLSLIDSRWGGSPNGPVRAQAWLSRIYRLLKQWTEYLIEFSLEPHNQLSTDDFAGWLALHSNLALKGIVGIKAMSELSAVMGLDGDVKYYRNISDAYVDKWQDFAMSRDGGHAKLAYNWHGSWTTVYSLYADAVLCFHPSITSEESRAAASLARGRDGRQSTWKEPGERQASMDFIPHAVYANQSAFYALVLQRYGLPLDSRHLYAKSDWMFEAAAVMEPGLRAEVLRRHANWVNSTVIDRPLSDLFETEDEDGDWGGGVRFLARPVVGGHFAGLALERACRAGGEGSELEDAERLGGLKRDL